MKNIVLSMMRISFIKSVSTISQSHSDIYFVVPGEREYGILINEHLFSGHLFSEHLFGEQLFIEHLFGEHFLVSISFIQ